jgi:hypothetical protein
VTDEARERENRTLGAGRTLGAFVEIPCWVVAHAGPEMTARQGLDISRNSERSTRLKEWRSDRHLSCFRLRIRLRKMERGRARGPNTRGRGSSNSQQHPATSNRKEQPGHYTTRGTARLDRSGRPIISNCRRRTNANREYFLQKEGREKQRIGYCSPLHGRGQVPVPGRLNLYPGLPGRLLALPVC